MKKNGFTLVELLAVIVILAVILVIAVPQINNVIKETRKNSLASTGKLIAAKAEEKEVENDALEKTESITCEDLVKLDDNYGNCTVSKNSTTGKWEVTIVGANKFSGYTCTGTKDNMECTEGSSTAGSSNWVYAFGSISNASEGSTTPPSGKNVYIRYNSSDLTENYVCTLYGGSETCFTSEVYNNRNESNSEWSIMQTLFDSSNCTESSSLVDCDVNVGSETSDIWTCGSNSVNAHCNWLGGSSYVYCRVNSDGSAVCGE